MKQYLGTLMILLVLVSCSDRKHHQVSSQEYPDSGDYTRFATGFEVRKLDSLYMVSVHDPWQNSRDISFTYLLGHEGVSIPDSLSVFPVINIPVQRVVTLSTTYLAMIDELDRLGSVCGISGTGLVYNSFLRDRIATGEIKEVGFDPNLNLERILDLNPDVIFVYGVEGTITTTAEKLKEMGIQVVFCGDYLEPHPLGKAEWLRFFSLFYNEEELGTERFNRIAGEYLKLSGTTKGTDHSPAVLTGLPWKDTWYMAGGKSFAAKLITDAGGNYLWGDTESSEAIPLDLESVISKAVSADYWINPGAARSISEILKMEERLAYLPVVQTGEIYNNDARLNSRGGNDYWESGAVHPERILADLIKIFHPELTMDHKFVYYRKLK